VRDTHTTAAKAGLIQHSHCEPRVALRVGRGRERGTVANADASECRQELPCEASRREATATAGACHSASGVCVLQLGSNRCGGSATAEHQGLGGPGLGVSADQGLGGPVSAESFAVKVTDLAPLPICGENVGVLAETLSSAPDRYRMPSL
jgi:hypothetical protein